MKILERVTNYLDMETKSGFLFMGVFIEDNKDLDGMEYIVMNPDGRILAYDVEPDVFMRENSTFPSKWLPKSLRDNWVYVDAVAIKKGESIEDWHLTKRKISELERVKKKILSQITPEEGYYVNLVDKMNTYYMDLMNHAEHDSGSIELPSEESDPDVAWDNYRDVMFTAWERNKKK